MEDLVGTAIGTIDVILVGGPDSLPEVHRRQRLDVLPEKIKICHYGGHEHFGRVDGDAAADGPVQFHWVGRTRIAE